MRRKGSVAFGLAVSGALLIGCGSRDNWQPLVVGKTWTYRVQAGFDHRIESIRVMRALSVASVEGFELAGPLGVSRIAWKHGTLVADSTVNARFLPAVPLLVPGADIGKDLPKQVAVWHCATASVAIRSVLPAPFWRRSTTN